MYCEYLFSCKMWQLTSSPINLWTKLLTKAKDRPQIQGLLTRLRAGDTLVVWKLDRLGRSLKDLVTLVTGFQEKGIHFVSLHDHLDTTTAQGRLMFNLFASLAEFERDIIRERTKVPLAGRAGPRPARGAAQRALERSPVQGRRPLKRSTCSRIRPWPKSASCSASGAPPFTATSST